MGQLCIPVYQTEKAEEGNAAQYPCCKDDEDRKLHEGSLANIRRSTLPRCASCNYMQIAGRVNQISTHSLQDDAWHRRSCEPSKCARRKTFWRRLTTGAPVSARSFHEPRRSTASWATPSRSRRSSQNGPKSGLPNNGHSRNAQIARTLRLNRAPEIDGAAARRAVKQRMGAPDELHSVCAWVVAAVCAILSYAVHSG